MVASKEKKTKEGAGERTWRFLRDVNIIGALALGSLAVLAPVGATVLTSWAVLNAVQAGGFEAARHHAKKKREKKNVKQK